MAPAKKSSPSKAPKKAATKSAPTHPSWTDMIKVLTTSTIYSTSPSLVIGGSRPFKELCVIVVSIVFLKRGISYTGHCRAGDVSVSCVTPTRCVRAVCASSPIIPFFGCCAISVWRKADYHIALLGVHFQSSRGLARWRFSPSNQEVRSYSMLWRRLLELRYASDSLKRIIN